VTSKAPEDGGDDPLNGLHSVISQKIALFISTAVRTSNPTFACVLIFLLLPLRKLALAVTLLKILGSNLGRETDYSEVLLGSPQSSHKNTVIIPLIRS
jgi:hypothetical protein